MDDDAPSMLTWDEAQELLAGVEPLWQTKRTPPHMTEMMPRSPHGAAQREKAMVLAARFENRVQRFASTTVWVDPMRDILLHSARWV